LQEPIKQLAGKKFNRRAIFTFLRDVLAVLLSHHCKRLLILSAHTSITLYIIL